MSTKTLRKRIALVAVSALGAGLLTVASVAPANSTVEANELVPYPVGSVNTVLNVCSVSSAGNVDTAVIPLSSAGIKLGTQGTVDVNDDIYVSVSGPGVISALGSATMTAVSQTIATSTTLSTATTLGSGTATDNDITIKPTGLGTIKVTYAVSGTSAALDVITITVVDKCATGTYSAANSLFRVVTGTFATTTASFSAVTSGIDDDAATVASADIGYVAMSLKDAYANALPAKALIASVSGANCLVAVTDSQNTSYSAATGSGTTAVDSDNGFSDVILVTQEDSDVPAKCTVSATWNGISVGSKTFTFRGIPAKITVSDVTIGSTSGVGYYRATVVDAAGNLLPGVKLSASSTQADNAAAIAAGVITSAQSQSNAVTSSTATGLGKSGVINAATLTKVDADGPLRYTCATTGGAAKITVRAEINAATASYLTSEPFNIACSGGLDTWTISLDKATYAPGEIATLTLSGKDSKGRPVTSFDLMAGVTYAFGGMTAVTAPTNNDTFTSGPGTKTYQFSVGTSEGAFVGTFKVTGATDTAAKTVQYKVANQNAAVSTNEVLAAIVKLIATINKQIRQLQKQLRR